MTKKLEDFTLLELKALAYDEIGKIDVAQNNLTILNRRIAEFNKPTTNSVTPKEQPISFPQGEEPATPIEAKKK